VTVAALASSNCAACGRPLTDAISIETGVGPDCRANYNYVAISKLSDADRFTVNGLLHTIAADKLYGDQLREAIHTIFLCGLADLAKRIERRVHRRLAPVQTSIEVVYEAVPVVPKPLNLPFTLTEGQERAREAVQRLMNVPGFGLCVNAGYAGVGKTTLMRVFGQEYGTPQIITPTGKAALRAKQATGLEASTIHRWIYAPKEDPRTGIVTFARRALDEIVVPAARLVLMDESSMVGPDVWKDVYDVCRQLDLKLVCVGDAFQLPPVQAPNAAPFSILSPEFALHHKAERIEMTEVLRQAQESPVIRASMKLRQGMGLAAFEELQKVDITQIWDVTTAVHRAGGITICHRNATRFQLNAGIRTTLGIRDEQPQPGEPLMCLKNAYEAGILNGETFEFTGWELPPDTFERVHDKYKDVNENARFGATRLREQRTQIVLALEELHGRLAAGTRAIEIAGNKWARLNNLFAGDTIAPTIHANFGYTWTAHKSQGSEWPYVLVALEPSIRLNEDEGRRWAYTAVTRATQATAVCITGRI